MKIFLNIGTAEIFDPALEPDHESEFAFTVEFDNGERAEITFEPDITGDPNEVHMVRCSMYAREDGPLLKREILHGA